MAWNSLIWLPLPWKRHNCEKNEFLVFGELFGYASTQNHHILKQCRCPLYTGVGWFWRSLELLCCHGNYTKIFKILKMLKTSWNFTVMMSKIGRCGIWSWNFQNRSCYHGNNAKRSKISKIRIFRKLDETLQEW